ncbi:Uncharacterised protein [Yersinia intermedia]|nr:Uncharacterised protein [Yersinia intermedia]CRF15662.1 Uncharacterised protein [Yersinia intermedia]
MAPASQSPWSKRTPAPRLPIIRLSWRCTPIWENTTMASFSYQGENSEKALLLRLPLSSTARLTWALPNCPKNSCACWRNGSTTCAFAWPFAQLVAWSFIWSRVRLFQSCAPTIRAIDAVFCSLAPAPLRGTGSLPMPSSGRLLAMALPACGSGGNNGELAGNSRLSPAFSSSRVSRLPLLSLRKARRSRPLCKAIW